MAPKMSRPPSCHIALCVTILGVFGVSAQFVPLQLYILDQPLRATTCMASGAKSAVSDCILLVNILTAERRSTVCCHVICLR